MLALVTAGYVSALRSEWQISPYRHDNMQAAHRELCVSGRVHPAHNMNVQVQGLALSDIRTLFCGDTAAAARQLDHGSIGRYAASGFYREERHTWVGPRLELLLPVAPRATRIEVAGWLPDTQAYDGGRFVIEVVASGSVVGRLETQRSGAFGITASLPVSAELLEVRASARRTVAGDDRELSWVLVSIAFE
jgi:hypothetical protein